MAEYKIAQLIFSSESNHEAFIIENPEAQEPEYKPWSKNLLGIAQTGFVRQLGIHAMPGTKVYLGPIISRDLTEDDSCLIIGPSGIFQANVDEGYLLMDVRLNKQSYDNAITVGQQIIFDFVGTYAPGNSDSTIVIYNGGGVSGHA